MAELPFATKEKIGCTVDYTAGRNRYMGYLMRLAIYSFKGTRIGLDAANGSAWTLAKGIFDALGAISITTAVLRILKACRSWYLGNT